MRRTTALAAAGAGAVLTVVACGGNAGTGDFASRAEDFITGELPAENVGGLTFTDADCTEPASTDVGTTYTCTATGSDGQAYSFGISIDTEDSLRVDSYTPTGAAGATTTTVVGATTTTTVAG